jgi:HTH-type transcriptional regulator/antitoxin HigA
MNISKEYRALIEKFPPFPIKTEEDFNEVQEQIDNLLDRNGELTEAEYDYLDVLGALVYDYESIALKVDDK